MKTQDQKAIKIIIPFVIFFYSCTSNDEPIIIGDPIGPISAEEFITVPIPTYEIVLEGYGNILSVSPSLLQSESEELSLALFEEVRKISTSNNSPNGGDLLESLNTRLSEGEWKLVLINPFKGFLAYQSLKTSFSESENSFSCDTDFNYLNSKADALRHAYWNSLMALNIEIEFVEKLISVHGIISNSEASKQMDIHNGKIGKELAFKYPDAKPDELLAILLQYDFLFIDNGGEIPPTYTGLVYLEGRNKLDVKMKGSFSNPDSGGPWGIEFDIYECGTVIRGNFTIIRGSERQDRRFSGSMINGSMQLEVSDPLIFENPRGLYACRGMKMNLTGNDENLEGRWTSSNCYYGGTVRLSRNL